MERIEPTEPMDRIEPAELTDRIESVELTDQRDLRPELFHAHQCGPAGGCPSSPGPGTAQELWTALPAASTTYQRPPALVSPCPVALPGAWSAATGRGAIRCT